MSEGPKVLAVFDAQDRNCAVRGWQPFVEWLAEHTADAKSVFRVELLLLDAPFVRLHEYERDAAGRKVRDAVTKLAVTRPPRDVLLRRMPPTPPS